MQDKAIQNPSMVKGGGHKVSLPPQALVAMEGFRETESVSFKHEVPEKLPMIQ